MEMNNLMKIRLEINGGKNNFNEFGHFAYRNAEELLNQLKPLLEKYGCNLEINNELCECAGRSFIKSVVTFYDTDGWTTMASAFAAVDFDRKGLDASQACGCAQSYATKYALCSLLLLSDSKLDPDSMEPKGAENQPVKKTNKCFDFKLIDQAQTVDELMSIYNEYVEPLEDGKQKETALDKLKKRKVYLTIGTKQ